MSLLDNIKEVTNKVEEKVESLGDPIKPYFPALSRFLIVATFYEDALRMLVQWREQHDYMNLARGYPSFFVTFFLLANIVVMPVCATAVIAKKQVKGAVGGLCGVVISQAIVYGMLASMSMFLRNISILGGLLLCLSEHLIKSSKSKNSVFASIPTLSPVERHQYFQLAGRILLMVLFLGMIISSRWTVASLVASLFSFAACVMIIVGFRAKWSASLLVSFLCVMNLLVNNWWSIDHASFRDSAKYNFFQTLSIMGGFLLLIVIGPGHLSYDEKKKDH